MNWRRRLVLHWLLVSRVVIPTVSRLVWSVLRRTGLHLLAVAVLIFVVSCDSLLPTTFRLLLAASIGAMLPLVVQMIHYSFRLAVLQKAGALLTPVVTMVAQATEDGVTVNATCTGSVLPGQRVRALLAIEERCRLDRAAMLKPEPLSPEQVN